MTKDLKTGMALGLLLAVLAVFWISARSDLGVDMGLSQKVELNYKLPDDPNDANAPGITLSTTTKVFKNYEPNLPQTEPEKTKNTLVVTPEEQGPNVPDLTIYEQDEKIKTEKFHIIRPEETLSDISRQYYGTPSKWKKIAKANPDTIKNPDKIKPGTKIIIPE